MIVPMKKAYIIVQQGNGRSMLRELRKAGLLHIETQNAKTERIEELEKTYDAIRQIKSVISDLIGKQEKEQQKLLPTDTFEQVLADFRALLDEKVRLEQQIAHDKQKIEQLSPWGEFYPAEIVGLCESGIKLVFYTLSKKDLALIDPSIQYFELAPVEGLTAIAVVNDELPPIVPATRFALPEHGIGFYRKRFNESTALLEKTIEAIKAGACYLDAFDLKAKKLEMEMRFEQVGQTLEESEGLVWITGYLPETEIQMFEKLAKTQSWAYLLDEIPDEDNPPTLVKYRKGVGIIKPVFDILGTVPGYRERDISTWFLLFFTLFFAMIIGDAGYGLIFLAVAVLLHISQKKASTLTMLLYVVSIATIVWGSLTGTWFGSKEILVALPLLQKLVIPSMSNYPELFGITSYDAQNQVMKFCFMIGTVQLSLACVMNVLHKIREKNLSLVADIGWLIDILALYFVVLQLVVGEPAPISLIFKIVGFGFALVVIFGSQAPGVSFGTGLKSGLGGLFTTFLNTISAFANIMSYIRLFAVGMASVAIAQSFNNMAGGMLHSWAFAAGVLVLAIGHSLNLVMGLLSVVVHGVRLNLLEFSGQLGMEWTGIAYEPFAQTVEEN